MKRHSFSRRNFLHAAAALPLAAALPAFAADAPSIKLGVATYTLRKMNVENAIKAIRQVGLQYASIKDFHLPLKSTPEQRRQVTQKFREGGVTPMSCGVITMNTEAAARQAFEYARDAGFPMIICNPKPELMPVLDRMAKEFDIRLALHNHGPESKTIPTPLEAYELVKKLDPRIGLCVDVGHTLRSKVNPADSILKCADRVYDVHLKDIDKAEPSGKCIEGGRGVLDMKAVLAALIKINFNGLAAFEYEKDENNPIPGLDETVKHTRKLLAELGQR